MLSPETWRSPRIVTFPSASFADVTAPSAIFAVVTLPSGGARLTSLPSFSCITAPSAIFSVVTLPSGTVSACTANGTLPNCTRGAISSSVPTVMPRNKDEALVNWEIGSWARLPNITLNSPSLTLTPFAPVHCSLHSGVPSVAPV